VVINLFGSWLASIVKGYQGISKHSISRAIEGYRGLSMAQELTDEEPTHPRLISGREIPVRLGGIEETKRRSATASARLNFPWLPRARKKASHACTTVLCLLRSPDGKRENLTLYILAGVCHLPSRRHTTVCSTWWCFTPGAFTRNKHQGSIINTQLSPTPVRALGSCPLG
jgi:hypothetical protein